MLNIGIGKFFFVSFGCSSGIFFKYGFIMVEGNSESNFFFIKDFFDIGFFFFEFGKLFVYLFD